MLRPLPEILPSYFLPLRFGHLLTLDPASDDLTPLLPPPHPHQALSYEVGHIIQLLWEQTDFVFTVGQRTLDSYVPAGSPSRGRGVAVFMSLT